MSFAPSTKRSDQVLGLVVVVTLILVAITTWLFMRGGDDERFILHTKLSSSFGITAGASVRLHGVVIGEVSSVKLTDEGAVQMSLSLSSQHAQLYRRNSLVRIDTTLAIDSVLTGVGLEFLPSSSGPALRSGDSIDAEAPKTLDQLMSDWNIQSIMQRTANVLAQVEQVVANVNGNQQQISQAIEHMMVFSERLANASSHLPDIMQRTDRTLTAIEQLARKGQQSIETNEQSVTEILQQSLVVSQHVDRILTELAPVISSLPRTQQSLHQLLDSSHQLTEQLRQHWLLQPNAVPARPHAHTGPMPHDNRLYDLVTDKPE